MTKEEYAQMAGANLAELEEIAAMNGMTGQDMVESYADLLVQHFKERRRDLGAPRNAVVAQVSENVIQVNFRTRAPASWTDRKARQEPSKRRQFANRVSLMPITVPSTAPAQNSSSVSSTSPDTVIPYSSC
jgi:hypothetical protein